MQKSHLFFIPQLETQKPKPLLNNSETSLELFIDFFKLIIELYSFSKTTSLYHYLDCYEGASNPVAIELEVVVMDWLAAALGLSEEFFHTSGKGGGLVQCVAGEALLSAVMSARIKKIRELEQGNTIDHDALFYHPIQRYVIIM